MLTLSKTWFLTAAAFATVFIIDDWFGASLYARLMIIAAAASAIVKLIHPSQTTQPPAASPPLRISDDPKVWVRRELPASELALAIEHVQSIRVLLQVSASHNQPIPRAVLVNLDLVLKSLRKLNGTSTSDDESAPDPDSSVSTLTAHH